MNKKKKVVDLFSCPYDKIYLYSDDIPDDLVEVYIRHHTKVVAFIPFMDDYTLNIVQMLNIKTTTPHALFNTIFQNILRNRSI